MQLYYGEGTRLLEWDPTSKKFLLADVDLSGGGKGNASSPVLLYSVDPSDGTSTVSPLAGVSGYPVGLAWDAPQGTLLLTTQSADHVSFFRVEVNVSRATLLSSQPRGASESSTTFYAAYVSHAHDGVAYRAGHKMVSTGQNLGLGSVDASSATPGWTDLAWQSHDLPATLHAATSAVVSPGFVALAQRKGGHTIDYDVISFGGPAAAGGVAGGGLDYSEYKVIARLNNSHPPTVPLLKEALGYVGASLVGHSYAALTVEKHPNIILPGVGDKWSLATLDLKAADVGGSLKQLQLKPQPSFEGAETVSLSGFGLAA